MIVIDIGRGENNDIAIADPKVSRTHLQLVRPGDGSMFATDLGSTNGTWVNGVRITKKHPLHDGDEIRIGNTTICCDGGIIKIGNFTTSWDIIEFNQIEGAIGSLPIRVPASEPATVDKGEVKGAEKTKCKNKLYIGIGVAAVVIVAIVVGVLTSNKGKSAAQKEQSDNEKYNELRQRQLEASEAAATAQYDHEKEMRRKAEEKGERESAIADSLLKQNEKINQKSAKQAEELKQKQAAIRQAESSLDEAREQNKKLKNKLSQQESTAKANSQKAEEALAAKSTELSAAQKELALTKELHKTLRRANKNELKKICDSCKIGSKGKNEAEMYDLIVSKFEKCTKNSERQEMLNKARKAVGEKSTANKVTDTTKTRPQQ